MKILERKNVKQPQKQIGLFAFAVEELAAFKTGQANKILAKVKNLDKI